MIATADQVNINGDSIQLLPATIMHQDGSQETIYIENIANKKQKHFFTHVQMTYIMVGTLALLMSAYFTYLQLKRMKNE